MNIFTKDDYRKIQAWLKANSIKDSDLTSVNDTIPEEDTLVLVQKINGILSNVKISIKNLLNSTLSKIIIDTIIANAVKVNNTLTVTASNVKIDNEKGTTLQDVLDYFEGNKLNRHTDDTFDGNLTVKKNITIEGNIKSHDDTITVEADLETTGEITDGQGNMLSDVNDASKGWKIEYQDPQQDEPTVRAKYVLKDYRGVPKGNVIKVYKDSAITNVYLGTIEDTCNPNTGEVTKHPIHDNNEALSIVYRLDTGKYSLVNVPIKMFTTEAEFDKYRGLGVTSNGQVFIKLASDVESSNYLHFNELGEITADGIETRILRDLGNIITSIAGDGTMWGVYKEHEGTQETSTPNDGSRWGEFKRAEEIREEASNSAHQVFADNWDVQDDDPEIPQDIDIADEASYAYNWKTTDTPASDGKTEGNLKDLYQKTLNQEEKLLELESEIIYDVSAHNNGIAFSSLSALLSAENLSTLIPLEIRYGGMSIRFIQGSEHSSDNKYIQARCMAQNFTTDITQWQSVDDKPIVGSRNLVESGGVEQKISNLLLTPTIIAGEATYYIDLTNAQVGQIYTISKGVSNNWTNWEITCKEGDKFVLTTKLNLETSKAYAILDSNNIVLQLHKDAVINAIVEIPQGGVKLLVNSRNDAGDYSVIQYINKIDILETQKIDDAPQDNKSYLRKNGNWAESTADIVTFNEEDDYSEDSIGKAVSNNIYDIKVVSDIIKPQINILPTTNNYYIDLKDIQIGQEYTINNKSFQDFSCWEIDCNKGDIFILTTKLNLETAKAYVILDENNIVLELHKEPVTDTKIIIPSGGTKLLVNSRNNAGDYYVKQVINKISDLEDAASAKKVVPFDNVGYIDLTGIRQGTVINPYEHIIYTVDWRYIIENVNEGQVVTLTTSNNLPTTAKSYAILDDNYKVLQYKEYDSRELEVYVPAKSKYFVSNTRIYNPTRKSSFEVKLYAKNYLQEQIDEINAELHPSERDFIKIIESQKGIISACCGFGHGEPTDYGQNAALVVITDIHGCNWPVEDAGKTKNVHKVFNHTHPVIINMGDMFAGRPCSNGEMYPFYDTYMALAQKYCVYHTIGQHEVGFDLSGDNNAGRNPLNCLTHEEVFNKFIAPMKSVWNLPDLDTIYYYKDLVFKNSGGTKTTMRLISLYEWNCPLYLDSNGNYKYPRATVWYGSTQLQWLADTLASTPDGALVVLMTHRTELRVIKYKETPFARGAVGEDIPQQYMMLTSDPVVDIVNAFINRENFSKLYSLSNEYKSIYTESDFDDFTITKDFTQCKGIFANEFTGDTHVDRIGKAYNTDMLVFTLTASGTQSIDCDVDSGNSISSSIVNIVGYNKKAKRITIGRLGQQYSLIGVRRDIDNFYYK